MDKLEILKLKNSGMSYTEIEKLTGVKKASIKSIVRRARLSAAEPTFCQCCGKRLNHIPGKKKKKFCNDFCRSTYYRIHKDAVKRNKSTYICPVCGKEFKDYASRHPKYCSLKCYWKRK